jgi:hypothetical protein
MGFPVYRELAVVVGAYHTCVARGHNEWKQKHEERAEELVKRYLPSGSGIDNGVKLDWDKSTSEKLVFTFGYHHMNEHGMYSGWTDHTLIVTPSLMNLFDLRITGRDRNQIKEYLYDTFRQALREMVV